MSETLEWILQGLVYFIAAVVILMVLDLIRYIIKGVWKGLMDHLDERNKR